VGGAFRCTLQHLNFTTGQLSEVGQWQEQYTNAGSTGSGKLIDYPNICTWAGFSGPLTHYLSQEHVVQLSSVDLLDENALLVALTTDKSTSLTTYAWCASGVPLNVPSMAQNFRGDSDTTPLALPFQVDDAWCCIAGGWSNAVSGGIIAQVGTSATWQVTGKQADANCLKPL